MKYLARAVIWVLWFLVFKPLDFLIREANNMANEKQK